MIVIRPISIDRLIVYNIFMHVSHRINKTNLKKLNIRAAIINRMPNELSIQKELAIHKNGSNFGKDNDGLYIT